VPCSHALHRKLQQPLGLKTFDGFWPFWGLMPNGDGDGGGSEDEWRGKGYGGDGGHGGHGGHSGHSGHSHWMLA